MPTSFSLDEDGAGSSFWHKRTSLEKKLIIGLAFATVLVIVLLGVTIGIAAKHHKSGASISTSPTAKIVSSTPTPHPNVCNSEDCKNAARSILFSMNSSAEPCDDFYEYACGGFIEKDKLSPSEQRTSVFDEVKTLIDTKINHILKRKETKDYSNSMLSAIKLYNQCIDTDSMNNTGIQPLQELVKDLLGVSWPIANGYFSSDDFDRLKAIANLAKEGITTFLNIFVLGGLMDATTHALYVRKLESYNFDIDTTILTNTTADERAIKKTEALKAFIGRSARIMMGGANVTNQTQFAQDVKDILEIEIALAEMQGLTGQEDSVQKIKIKDFEAKLNITGGEFLEFLKYFVPSLTSDTKIYAIERANIKKVFTLVSKKESRIIANYLGWKLVRYYGKFTVQEFRDAYLEFKKVITGVTAPLPMNTSCTVRINGIYGYAIAGEYSKQYFPESAKGELKLMMEDIINAFKEKVKKVSWMDDMTRSAALEKANNILSFIAYPDWTTQNDAVDAFYSNLTKGIENNVESFLLNLHTYHNFVSTSNFDLFGKPVNRSRWDNLEDITPLDTNAFYSPSKNTINILAGILDGAFYAHGKPDSVNYGAIGLVMGHELTHGFDNSGRQYDKIGNLKNWWQNETLEAYQNLTLCFVKQYHKIVDEQTHLHLDGRNTLGENIADNGGIRRAYSAFMKKINRTGDSVLPGFEGFSPQQMFFLSFGHVWCGKERTPYLRKLILHNPHSPERYRVNVVARNFEEFSNAYNCPLGSKMHPKDTCEVW